MSPPVRRSNRRSGGLERLVKDLERIVAQPRLARGIERRPLRRALLPELPHPAPEVGVERRAQAQRLVVAPQRTQQHFRRRRRRPGIGMAGREQSGVGIARKRRRLGFPVDDDDLMAVALELDKPSSRRRSRRRAPVLSSLTPASSAPVVVTPIAPAQDVGLMGSCDSDGLVPSLSCVMPSSDLFRRPLIAL